MLQPLICKLILIINTDTNKAFKSKIVIVITKWMIIAIVNTSSMIIDSSIDSNNNELNLPFETSDDPEVIKTTNFSFSALLKLEWTRTETYESYLGKINSYKNKYFDVRNYKEVALNTLLLKQLIGLKIKLKEHITKIDLLFDEQICTKCNQATKVIKLLKNKQQ